MTTMRIPLSRGMFALIDAVDYDRVVAMGKWCADPSSSTFYARKNIYHPEDRSLTSLLMHNFITGWTYVDHVNGDGLDNRRNNLRQANHSLNMRNKRLYRNNTSGFKGVMRNRGKGKPWYAAIKKDGRIYRLGNHLTPEDAARAYDKAALDLFGEFARLNFPQESGS